MKNKCKHNNTTEVKVNSPTIASFIKCKDCGAYLGGIKFKTFFFLRDFRRHPK